MNKYETLCSKLKEFNQENVLKYWNDLNDQEKEMLYEDLIDLDLNQIKSLISNSQSKKDLIKRIDFTKQTTTSIENMSVRLSQEQFDQFELLGLEAISNGQLAIIVLAGGLSTRLGISFPIGMYSVDLLSSKTLYQLQAERLIRLKTLAARKFPSSSSCSIPWYIMTSQHTHTSTIKFFQENNYFGLDMDSVQFFKQEMVPCLTNDARLILDEKFKLKKTPNGTGGLYDALVKHNLLEHMANLGVKYVHIYTIENLLVKIADPIFTGYCMSRKIDCSAKVIKKNHVDRTPLNSLCLLNDTNDGTPSIIDASLISDSRTQIEFENHLFKNKNSIFNLADVSYYFMSYELLSDLCRRRDQLQFYKLERVLSFLNGNDQRNKQNCWTFEKFLTDLFPTNLVLFEVDRQNEFYPLKSLKPGEQFNPKGCKKNLIDLHYEWLVKAGAVFHYPSEPNTQIKTYNHRNDEMFYDLPSICEVSPLVSYAGEDLEKYVKDKSFEPPLVLELDLETNQVTYNGLDFESFNKAYPTEIKFTRKI